MNRNMYWLAINIYHEARGETLAGQCAVGHVTLNRAIKKNKSVEEIVKEPQQFSWRNGNKTPPIKDYEAFIRAFAAAKLTTRQRLEGITLNHSDHYFNYKLIDKPVWAVQMTETAKVGDHVFFRS